MSVNIIVKVVSRMRVMNARRATSRRIENVFEKILKPLKIFIRFLTLGSQTNLYWS